MRKMWFAAASMALVGALALPVMAQDAVDVPVWIAFTDANRLGWTQERAAEFNEQFPQYNVTITGYANYEEIFAATALAAEQGSLPAIIQQNEVSTQFARDSGYFRSIEGALAGRTEVNGIAVNLDDFIGPVAAYYTLGGEFTSMPWNTSSSIMFSNMSFLDAAGVETPPATWAEIDAACETIMAADNAPEYCWTWPNHGWFFEQWVAQQGGEYANNGNGRDEAATEVAFNNEAGNALLTFLKEQYDKGYLYYSGARDGDSWGTVDQAFSSQQVAMAVYSSSDTTTYTQVGVDNGFEVVASFLPYNDETGWTGNILGGASLWLVDGLDAEVEDGALTFLLWLTNTENAATWHQVTGYMPIRLSAIDALSEEGWFEENPNFIVAANQLAESEVTPATSGALLGVFNESRSLVTQAIENVLLSDADPAEALNEAAEQANVVLEEYNLLNAE